MRRSRKGIAGLISAIILFTLIFTTGAAYFMLVGQTQKLQEVTAKERDLMQLDKQSESLIVRGSSDSGNVDFRVNNTGSIPIKIVSAFLMDNVGTFYTSMDNQSIVVNSGAASNVTSTGQPYVSGNQYVIKVVTERGNTGISLYPLPVESSRSQYSTYAVYSSLASAIGSIRLEFKTFKWVWATAGSPPNGLTVWAPDGVDQSGFLVDISKGYPGHAAIYNSNILFSINVTNCDPSGEAIYLRRTSMIRMLTYPGSSANVKVVEFPLRKGYSMSNHTYITLPTSEYMLLPFNVTVTIDLGSSALDELNVMGPFLSLFGKYQGGKPYSQTLPFEGTIPATGSFRLYTGATNNYNYQGSPGESVSIVFAGYAAGARVAIGFIKQDETEYQIAEVVVPSSPYRINNAFTIPSLSALDGPGYYTLYATDLTSGNQAISYATFRVLP